MNRNEDIIDSNDSSEEGNEQQMSQSINEDLNDEGTIDSNEENNNSEENNCQEIQQNPQQIFENSLQSYSFKTENGQTVYRVVTVDDSTHQTIVTPTIGHTSSSTNPSIALLTHSSVNPFGTQLTTNPVSSQTTPELNQPFYVMMTTTTTTAANNPSNDLQTNRRGKGNPIEGSNRVLRDEKRRATHNEVERRRRDKINNWIIKLSRVVPDCQQDHTKQGQSKGGILAKATEYIQELTLENARMNEVLKENEILNNELDAIRQQFVDAKNENRKLKALLQKYDIPLDSLETNQ